MITELKHRESNYPRKANFACIRGKNYAVPLKAKSVSVCSRGFVYYQQEQDSAMNNDSWGSNSKLLHTQHPTNNLAWPVRLLDRDGKAEVFECTSQPADASLSLVDCTRYS